MPSGGSLSRIAPSFLVSNQSHHRSMLPIRSRLDAVLPERVAAVVQARRVRAVQSDATLLLPPREQGIRLQTRVCDAHAAAIEWKAIFMVLRPLEILVIGFESGNLDLPPGLVTSRGVLFWPGRMLLCHIPIPLSSVQTSCGSRAGETARRPASRRNCSFRIAPRTSPPEEVPRC